jgi:hypothetical protein
MAELERYIVSPLGSGKRYARGEEYGSVPWSVGAKQRRAKDSPKNRSGSVSGNWRCPDALPRFEFGILNFELRLCRTVG